MQVLCPCDVEACSFLVVQLVLTPEHLISTLQIHTSLRAVARRGERPLPQLVSQQQQGAAAEQEQEQPRTWRFIMTDQSLAAAAMGRVRGVLSGAGFKYPMADLK